MLTLQVYPAIKRLTGHGAEFVDGRVSAFDAVILATGYKSNVPSWLKVWKLGHLLISFCFFRKQFIIHDQRHDRRLGTRTAGFVMSTFHLSLFKLCVSRQPKFVDKSSLLSSISNMHFLFIGIDPIHNYSLARNKNAQTNSYFDNKPCWLITQERNFFSDKDGLPRKPFPNGWKGDWGLYAVGFTKLGLLGASMDAKRIAQDIERSGSPG